MSNNPVMNRNPYFQGQATTPNTQYPAANQGQYAGQGQYGQYPQNQYDPYAQNAAQYSQQAQYAGAFQEQQARPGAMTYDDAMVKTLILLAVAVVSGAATMALTPTIGSNNILVIAIVTSIAAFVIGMVAAFQKMVKPWLAIGYALLEGIALGALTGAVDMFYPGVGLQAVLGTVIVVGVAVFLHVSGKVRTTPKGRRIVSVVLISYIIFGVMNLILTWTGILPGFGMRGGAVGIILGLFIIAVAGYMLIGDLETVKLAVQKNAPREFAWTCAFGIVMTVLWIYVEILRIAMIFASDR